MSITRPYRLYGIEASLYSARARSYMRKNAVPFLEIAPGDPRFLGKIVPAIGRWMMPVLETPEGNIVQDGADIIDHLDRAGFSKAALYPQDPVWLVIGHVFELFGNQGLLRAAMHYRWNFDEVNLPFLRDSFGDLAPPGASHEMREQVFDRASARMRKATRALGVHPHSIEVVERSYAEFLRRLNAHLEAYPFLLGGHATLADYGLIGAMYAHLGRDPAPLRLMQTSAPRVFRWVERMNMAETAYDRTQAKTGEALIEPGAVPETLRELLRFIAEDYLPEIAAHVGFANDWLDAHPEVTAGTSTKDEIMRAPIGMAEFAWHGVPISSLVLPYRFYLLGRLQAAFDRQDEAAQGAIRSVLSQTGLAPLLELRTKRPVLRADNHEMWGERIEA